MHIKAVPGTANVFLLREWFMKAVHGSFSENRTTLSKLLPPPLPPTLPHSQSLVVKRSVKSGLDE